MNNTHFTGGAADIPKCFDQIRRPLVYRILDEAGMPKRILETYRKYLEGIKTNKATAHGDIPAKIIKEFAQHLCVPFADVINTGLAVGHWPTQYKRETITPTPKYHGEPRFST